MLLRVYSSTWKPNCDAYSSALFYLFLSFNHSYSSAVTLPLFGNSNLIVFSVSDNFPFNSKRGLPSNSWTDNLVDFSWTGSDSVCDHLRDVPSDSIFNMSISAALKLLNDISLMVFVYPSSKVFFQVLFISMIFRYLCCTLT